MKKCAALLSTALTGVLAGTMSAQAQPALSVPAPCPAERAIYEMRTESGDFAAGFVPARSSAGIASNLYFQLTTPQRSYWFKFAVANGYGGVSLVPISDPYAQAAATDGPRELGAAETAAMGFYAFNDRLLALDAPPQAGEASPSYLMFPEVGAALWYGPAALSEGATDERDPMPLGMFQRTQCLVAPPAPAYP